MLLLQEEGMEGRRGVRLMGSYCARRKEERKSWEGKRLHVFKKQEGKRKSDLLAKTVG